MKKFLASQMFQWFCLNILRQKWVVFDPSDRRLLEKSNTHRTEGDATKEATTILTDRGEWDKVAVCRCLNAPGYLLFSDEFGLTMACLGYQLKADQLFAFAIG